MERLNTAVAEAVDHCIAQNILGDFLKKHRSEVIAVTLYEYNEEEHRRIQEQDKSRLKKELETTIENFKTKLQESESKLQESESKLQQSESKLQQSESKLQQSESKLQKSESKHVQSIRNTITVLRSMGMEDSLICSKLCEIYQIDKEEAASYMDDSSSSTLA